MWEQVEEDLTFPNISGLFLLYVQGSCISIYNTISSLYNFIFWHHLFKTFYIHILPTKEACNHYRYGNQALLWRCSPRRWQISHENVGINRKGNRTGEKGALLYKHFLVCDRSLGTKFLQEIQAHYDNNLKPEMLIKKL
jgi:hypothetical protein